MKKLKVWVFPLGPINILFPTVCSRTTHWQGQQWSPPPRMAAMAIRQPRIEGLLTLDHGAQGAGPWCPGPGTLDSAGSSEPRFPKSQTVS